ncbi:spore germination protein [Brevibacillus choshinensis]|uniref:Spore germination protein n=1 Tax=Brevibacillus choshinensis TaxID=54911 RepID=A0ABX7FMZ1_BRECH|nr:spore germination protein [Brevibacillus choshinensis]QRG67034.1 spore germination protein [Brevibacillus choshinensis]
MTREEQLQRLFSHCGDVVLMRFVTKEDQPMLLVYCQGLVDLRHLQEVVIPQLDSRLSEGDLRALPISFLLDDEDQWVDRLFAGDLLLFLGEGPPFAWDISSRPQRTPEEANTEVSIKGPRDGFIEDLSSNIALIRKRMRTLSLACEPFTIGTRSRTKVALLYMRDGTPPDIVDTIRERLLSCSEKKIINSAILEQKLSDQSYSLFPLVDYSGRPDFTVFMLMQGKAVVIVDGSPVAIIAPITLLELIKSPEDDQYPVGYVWLERILRLGGIWISVFLPGFWIALSAYNIEEFPFQLLATITQGRKGLPFSAPMELFGVLFIFEFLREAGARLPKTVGQTLALVGALIIGDASIRAGFTSPSMLFIGSLTVVASFTLINQSLSGAVTVARFFVFLLSAIVGTYGFVVSIIVIIYYLSTLTSIGRPYLLLNSSSNILSTLFLALFRPLISIFQQSSKKGRDAN